MTRVITFTAPRAATITTIPQQAVGPHDVRLRTLYTGISAGTELTAYRGTNPYLAHLWDDRRRLFVDGAETSESYPMEAWGYEEVGEVVERGSAVDEVPLGARVWGAWGHRTDVVVRAKWAAARVLPAGADARIGVFSKIGGIALNTLLDADIHVGETVAVFGLGVPGQLAAQLVRLNGGRVIAVDGIAARRDLAARLGADVVLDPADASPAEVVRDLTSGRGADVCLEITGSHAALHEAIRTVAYNSRVVVAGFFQGGAAPLRLGEEFHHNRIDLRASQISGVAPGLQHRWDEYRLAATAIDLAVDERLDVLSLISHSITFAHAADAYRQLDDHPEDALQVVLDATEEK